MTYYFKPPKVAFKEAIQDGRLSSDPKAHNYAGQFMYMGTENNGHDMFKDIVTRQYLPRKVSHAT